MKKDDEEDEEEGRGTGIYTFIGVYLARENGMMIQVSAESRGIYLPT